MKLVIAAPLYPPDVGGPSYYAQGLEASFKKMGHEVVVVPYGDLRRSPMGLSHLRYFLRIKPHLRSADAVIALDTASVALPAWCAARFAGIPFIIRTGGDFVWEHYLERTKNPVPLTFFYDEIRDFSAKEHLVFALTRFIVRRSILVFSTELQRDAWAHPYGLDIAKTCIIGNAVDAPLPAEVPTTKNFLWYVRPIAMKNGERVHAAFEKAKQKNAGITLEEGQVTKEKLLERMRSCYAVILPSITEISPNYILDALRFKKPFIMDKYSGFAQWLAPYGILVDPLNVDEIVAAIERLATDAGYKEALEKVSKFSFVRTYDDVAKDFLALIK